MYSSYRIKCYAFVDVIGIRTRYMWVDDLSLFVYGGRRSTRFSSSIEVLLATKLFTRELSGGCGIKVNCQEGSATYWYAPDAEAMVVGLD